MELLTTRGPGSRCSEEGDMIVPPSELNCRGILVNSIRETSNRYRAVMPLQRNSGFMEHRLPVIDPYESKA